MPYQCIYIILFPQRSKLYNNNLCTPVLKKTGHNYGIASVRMSVNHWLKRRFSVFINVKVLCLNIADVSWVVNKNLCFRCWIWLIFWAKFNVFWTFAFSSGLYAVSHKVQVWFQWNLNHWLHQGYCMWMHAQSAGSHLYFG